MIQITYAQPCIAARGACGQVVDRSDRLVRVQLMLDPLNSSVSFSQMALNAKDTGLAPGEYRTVAVDRVASVVAVHKAYRGN